MSFTIGSLFDGSGGFPLAAFMCGGVPKWAAEIEPYPIAVTKTRFPYMKHLGSVTNVKGNEVEPVDVITFGSPCQDLSIAGKRAGLKHEDNGDDETTRSGLFMEAVRIIKEMREATNGVYPRFALWENVPGAFSSNKGEDFRIVLEELIKIVEPAATMPTVPKSGWPYSDHYCGDGWSLAYRTMDSQFWGVPQRRRRIYLVLDLGGQCAGEVSFERDGLRGYFAEGRAPWKAIAGYAERGAGTADCEGVGINGEIATTLDASYYKGCGMRQGIEREVVVVPVVAIDQQGGKGGANYAVDVMPTICSDSHGTPHAVAYSVQDRAGKPGGGKGMLVQEDRATSLRTANYQYIFQPVAFTQNQREEVRDLQGVAAALPAEPGMHQQTFVVDAMGFDMYNQQSTGEVSRTLKTPVGGDDLPVACVGVLASSAVNAEITDGEISPCLMARAGTGGNQLPLVALAYDARGNGDGGVCPTITGDHNNRVTDYTSVVVEPHPIHDQATRFSGKRGEKQDGKGNGLGVGTPDDPMFTLTGGDRHAVAYGTFQETGFGWWNEDEVATTLRTPCGGDATKANLVVAAHGIGNGQANQPFMEEKVGALNCMHDQQAVCYSMKVIARNGKALKEMANPICASDYKDPDFVVYPAETYGVDCRNFTETPELYPTLQAKSNGGQSLNYSGAVRTHYIVRRLTPTECARLQGFPDFWGHPDKKDSFTDEEYEFWLNVRNTHAEINGKAVKSYTKDQMLTWYNKLHTDSAEYKLWGNGIALPTALYVMQGIAEVLGE